MIRVGDSVVEYSEDFRLYIVTKHSNPHFGPDVSTKVTLVNFTISMEGLQDQLLSIVVMKGNIKIERCG